MFARGMSAIAVVTEKGFTQLSDRGALEKLCDEVLAARPKSVADFRSGTAAALNFLKGQVMKLSAGQANPPLVGEILLAKLNSTSAG
jgi:aspartyl-tRNA(Asn)/glutamyl-tRNA(Gln) amidotransferase subunit B